MKSGDFRWHETDMSSSAVNRRGVPTPIGTILDRLPSRIIEDCGHWVPEEKPEELARRLLEFFAQ